jgi:hypothetical protein
MDMAQKIEPKFVASGTGPAPANEKRRVNSRRSTSDECSTNLIAANSANDWRMEIGHVHQDGGPPVGLLSIVTLLILASARRLTGGAKKTATRAPTMYSGCAANSFQTLPRLRSASNRESAFSLRHVGPCLRARLDSKCHSPRSGTFPLCKVWRQGCVQRRRFKTQERPA